GDRTDDGRHGGVDRRGPRRPRGNRGIPPTAFGGAAWLNHHLGAGREATATAVMCWPPIGAHLPAAVPWGRRPMRAWWSKASAAVSAARLWPWRTGWWCSKTGTATAEHSGSAPDSGSTASR